MARKMKDSGISWVGMMPAHWDVARLKELFVENRRPQPNQTVLSLSYGKIVAKNFSEKKGVSPESFDTYQGVHAGDVVLRLTDLQNDQKSLRVGYSEVHGIITSAYLCVRGRGLNPRFSAYLLHNIGDIQKVFYGLGGGVRQSMKFADLAEILIPRIPFDEQFLIASFLDHQTSLIDRRLSLIAKKKEALLKLQKTLISEAVVRGLQPNLPMKDSGVPWLGLIPSHWSLERCKNLFRISKNVVGDKAKEFTLLSLTKQGIIARDMENPQGKFPAEFDTYQIVKPGEFVFCLFDVEETPRTVELSSLYGMITGAYTVMKSLRPASSRYLYYQFLSFDNDKKLRPLYTGMRNTIPKEVFMGIVVALPPPDEQAAIVEMIDRETAIIKKQLELLSRQEILLAEQRKALIHEAITGKIDLSAYATDKSMLEAAPAA